MRRVRSTALDPFDLPPPRAIDSFCELVVERLAPLDAYVRAMFGCHGLYGTNDVFFGLIARGRLYLKTDDDTRPPYVAAGMRPFSGTDGEVILKRYYEVPPDVIDDSAALLVWAERAIAARSTTRSRARRSATKRT